MPENLFAVRRVGGDLTPLRVRLEQTIQEQVADIFTNQRQSFFNGVDEEVPFNGRWKPDANQLLTIEVPDEADVFRHTLEQNATSIPDLDTANFANAGIKALFTSEDEGGVDRILVQRFTRGQVLSRSFSLILHDNSFRRLTDAVFILNTSLTFVIEDDVLKFKSWSNLRSILNVLDIYREATDPEVLAFASHPSLDVSDIEDFMSSADQVTRKLINAVIASGVLDDHTTTDIQTAALGTQLELVLHKGRIVLPTERRDVKNILQFLDESRYSGPLSGQPYITNSRKPAQM